MAPLAGAAKAAVEDFFQGRRGTRVQLPRYIPTTTRVLTENPMSIRPAVSLDVTPRMPAATGATILIPKAFAIDSVTGKPVVDGQSILYGLQFWTHLQGMCKPWLASRSALARAKCLKTGAYFWHGVWRRLRDKHDLDRKCPTFARAYEKFVAIAPKEAEMPCFWSERCFQKYKPGWVQ